MYLYRQKFDVADLAVLEDRPEKVLLVFNENFLVSLYRNYLAQHGLDAHHCADLSLLKDASLFLLPKVLIVDPQIDQLAYVAKVLRETMDELPLLKVITVSLDSGLEDIRSLMDIGVCGHISRRFSKPGDVAVLVKSLLNGN
jgi:DNA-binding NarL/FixJ family response regulator